MAAGSNPFWRFSLRTWRQPGVQQACLALQEQCGADVNLLLFCGWTGRDGRVLDEGSLRSAIGRVGQWQAEVVAPLRLVRRGLKAQSGASEIGGLAMALRRRALAFELDLERVEQAMLAGLAEHWGEPAGRAEPRQAIAGNLASYLQLLGEATGAQEAAHLARLAQACAAAERLAVREAGARP